MPVIINLQSDLVRAANIALAMAYYPRSRDWLYPKLAGSTISTSSVEPFTIDGPSPLPVKFGGFMGGSQIPSFVLYVPNLLFKNIEFIGRSTIEFDQTAGLVLKRVDQIGIRMAEAVDFLFIKRILAGSSTASTTVSFEGTTYTTTMDGLPFFSAAHTTYPALVQSNIVQGSLPNTVSAIGNQDLATTANQLQRDFQLVLNTFLGFLDPQGVNIYTGIDAGKDIVVVLPPILWAAGELAFRTAGTIGGSSGSSSGATTSIGPKLVKDVFTNGLLAGCQDIESGGTIAPVNPTDVYYFITNDYTRPFYFQKFRPLKPGETKPPGNNVNAEAASAITAANALGFSVSPDAAIMYAETIVESNFNAVGANSQLDVVQREQFYVSGRGRFNFVYGPWNTAIRVKPLGGA